MRLNNYLTEDTNMFPVIEGHLRNDCWPFINDLRKNLSKHEHNERFLYRCKLKGILHIKSFRRITDRNPAATPQILQTLLDQEMEEVFGWKLRSTGVFASGSKWIHNYAGQDYFFFPQGEYKVVWFKGIKDFTIDIAGILTGDRSTYSLKDFIYNLESNRQDLQPYISGIMKKLKPKYRKGLKNYDLQSELVFDCDRYYLVNTRYIRSLGKFIYGD